MPALAKEQSDERRKSPSSRAILRFAAMASAGVLLVLAGFIVIDTLRTVIRLRSAFPTIDEWDDISVYQGWIEGQISTLQAFASPNYEHRIAVPRLILFSDYAVFGGRGTFDLLSIVLIQAIEVAILIRLAWVRTGPLAGRLAIAAIMTGLMFSLRQWHNFIWGFQVAFVGVYAVASCGVVLFAKAIGIRQAGGTRRAALAGAYASAFVATFTMASGMLVGAVMAALAIVSRAGWRVVGLTLGVTLAAVLAYKAGLTLQSGYTIADALGRLRQPGRLIAFTAIDLGNLQFSSMSAARLLGYGAMAVATLVALRTILGHETSRPRLALFGIMLFCLGSALMTAVGRLDYGMEQALSSRYSSGTSLFWSAALAYCWSGAGERAKPMRLQAAILVVGALFLTCAAKASRADRHDVESWSYYQQRAADLALTGLTQGSSDVNDGSSSFQGQLGFLKNHRLSVFSGLEGTLEGRPLESAGHVVAPSSCRGSLDSAAAIPEQIDLRGVALTGRGENGGSGRLYIVDPRGAIVGFASYTTDAATPTLWSGFARAPPGTILSAYQRLSGDGLCKIGEARVARPDAAAHPT